MRAKARENTGGANTCIGNPPTAHVSRGEWIIKILPHVKTYGPFNQFPALSLLAIGQKEIDRKDQNDADDHDLRPAPVVSLISVARNGRASPNRDPYGRQISRCFLLPHDIATCNTTESIAGRCHCGRHDSLPLTKPTNQQSLGCSKMAYPAILLAW